MSLMRILLTASLVMLVGTMAACGPPPPPEPPTNIVTDTNNNIDGKIEFTFEVEEQRKDRVSKILIYRDSDASGQFTNEVASISLTEGELDQEKRVYKFSFRDTNVLPGDKYDVKYYYKFACESPEGKKGDLSKAFDAASTNALAPKEVTSQTIQSENVSGGPQIVVSWQANSEFDIKGYYVFRSEEDKPIATVLKEQAVSPLIQHVAGKTLSWIDKTVQEGKPYWYVVAAVDKGDFISTTQPKTRFRGMVLAKAKLVAPDDGSSTAKPTFKWEKVDSASGYIVVILDDAVGGEQVWRSEYTTSTELTYPDSAPQLTTGKQYYWFVYTYLEKPQSNEEKGNSRSDVYSFTNQ